MNSVQLTISLRNHRPSVKRTVVVPSDASLYLLHRVIELAFDWDGDHLYLFETRRGRWGDPMLDDVIDDEAASVATLATREGAAFTYVFDLGDKWVHDINVDGLAEGRRLACLSASGPNPIQYHGDEPVPFDLDELNRWLAEIDLTEFEPKPAEAAEPEWNLPAESAARFAPEVRALPVIAAFTDLARWAAPGRSTTPVGYLKRAEVPAAHEVLGLPAPQPKFHSARNLTRFNGWWQTAIETGFIDIGTSTAVDGPAPKELEDDQSAVGLWLDLVRRSLFSWRAEHGLFHSEPFDNYGSKLHARRLLDQAAAADEPLPVAEFDGGDKEYNRELLAQLSDLGLLASDDRNRWQLSELGRAAVSAFAYPVAWLLRDQGEDPDDDA
ncbi:plasmid pRiA4b ORF-3 family protein [Glycomyces sp. L485]|uniref:plasmid pRiA4b ORF-3 family protein n=1 Tax=Glycomyces sp. L485 TaxID=2909235 RepID=UPI001F4AA218|nr:plasmid pRiA4b ORF-3 family protein [Glycomyces sp. L485]MCH7231071.1 plasmid pRiA4b ORF-3 family protein [Glycomyces sp. L485]